MRLEELRKIYSKKWKKPTGDNNDAVFLLLKFLYTVATREYSWRLENSLIFKRRISWASIWPIWI